MVSKIVYASCMDRTSVKKLEAIDYAGTRYSPSGSSTRFMLFKCICGKLKEISVTSVSTGRAKSCGCLVGISVSIANKKRANPNLIKAKQKKYPLRQCWKDMISRCYNPKNSMYKYYGEKGVIVCDEWKADFNKFRIWALQNGWCKGLQLDKDIIGDSKNYSPSTCCFVTAELNNLIKPSVKRYEYEGEMLNMAQISRRTGITIWVLNSRNKFIGGTIQDAIDHIKKWGATRYSIRRSLLSSV